MSVETRLLMGLLEYDGSLDPVIIGATSRLELYREALRLVQVTSGPGISHLVCDDYGWLAVHSFPDVDDVAAIAAWFQELGSSDELNDLLRLTVYEPNTATHRAVTRWQPERR